MLFDTDVLIFVQRGNVKAAALVESAEHRYISTQTYMELLQCAKNKTQHRNEQSYPLRPIASANHSTTAR